MKLVHLVIMLVLVLLNPDVRAVHAWYTCVCVCVCVCVCGQWFRTTPG